MRELIEKHIKEIQAEKVEIAHRIQWPLTESKRKELLNLWNELNDEQGELAKAIS